MQIKKTIAVLLAVFLIAVGFAIGYIINVSKESANDLRVTSDSTQLQKMDIDNRFTIRETIEAVLRQKDSLTIDSIMRLGRIKDSLLEVSGKIKIYLRTEEDPQILQQLNSTLTTVKDLVSESNKIIMDGAIEKLRPTNVALRTLVKEMKERTEKLQSAAKNIERLSDVISTLTNIISSPLFNGISAPVPAT